MPLFDLPGASTDQQFRILPHYFGLVSKSISSTIYTVCVCVVSGVVDTENVNPDDVVDHGSSRKHSADIGTTRVDRHKLYNPNHYQDDDRSVSLSITFSDFLPMN